MAKKEMKKDLLKMLKSDMMGMKKDKSDLFDGMLPEKKMQVTVAADSKEGLKEGLSKAEQIMKAKLGKKSEECEGCGKAPCEC